MCWIETILFWQLNDSHLAQLKNNWRSSEVMVGITRSYGVFWNTFFGRTPEECYFRLCFLDGIMWSHHGGGHTKSWSFFVLHVGTVHFYVGIHWRHYVFQNLSSGPRSFLFKSCNVQSGHCFDWVLTLKHFLFGFVQDPHVTGVTLRSEDEQVPRGQVSPKTVMKVSRKPAMKVLPRSKTSSMKVSKKPAVRKVRKVAVQKRPAGKAGLPSETNWPLDATKTFFSQDAMSLEPVSCRCATRRTMTNWLAVAIWSHFLVSMEVFCRILLPVWMVKAWSCGTSSFRKQSLWTWRLSGSQVPCWLANWFGVGNKKIEDQHEGTRFVFGHPRCAKLKARSWRAAPRLSLARKLFAHGLAFVRTLGSDRMC